MRDRIEAFLEHAVRARRIAPNTVIAYRNDLAQLGTFLQADAAARHAEGVILGAVDRETIVRFLLELKERGYAPATVARKIAATKSFFQYLWTVGEAATDPTAGLGGPEVHRALPHAVSSADVDGLIQRARQQPTPEGARDVAMLSMLAATGMRVGELVALDLGDASVSEGRLHVLGRGRRERDVPLDPETVGALEGYLQHARPIMAQHEPEEPALILNHRGKRLTRQGFWLILKALAQGTGLPQISPHVLRHSFAVRQVGEGMALEQIRRVMGHASIATTQVYSHMAARPTALNTESCAAPVPQEARRPARRPDGLKPAV